MDSLSTYWRARNGRCAKRISISPGPWTIPAASRPAELAVVTTTPVSTSTIAAWNTGDSTAGRRDVGAANHQRVVRA